MIPCCSASQSNPWLGYIGYIYNTPRISIMSVFFTWLIDGVSELVVTENGHWSPTWLIFSAVFSVMCFRLRNVDFRLDYRQLWRKMKTLPVWLPPTMATMATERLTRIAYTLAVPKKAKNTKVCLAPQHPTNPRKLMLRLLFMPWILPTSGFFCRIFRHCSITFQFYIGFQWHFCDTNDVIILIKLADSIARTDRCFLKLWNVVLSKTEGRISVKVLWYENETFRLDIHRFFWMYSVCIQFLST